MLDYVISQTATFLEAMPKEERKKKGQFFTSRETAEYMASLFTIDGVSGNVSILDPGTGTGILGTALVERLKNVSEITKITLTCYETDMDVLPVLRNNMEYIRQHCEKEFEYRILNEDYLLSQAAEFEDTLFSKQNLKKQDLEKQNIAKFDFIIGNPPYLRVVKNHAAAVAMSSVVNGAPNLYFLFAAMSLFNLKAESEMVYIIPRSWTSGAYFKAFRKYLFQHGTLKHIHLFVSRDKVFSQEQVLQETIIIKVQKTSTVPVSIELTSSQSNGDFNSITSINLPYDSVVVGEDLYVFLPTNETEVNVIKTVNRYTQTMPDLGFKMKTGIIVDFRQYESLREQEEADTCPLFYSQHIKNGRVNHLPSGKKLDWVITSKPGLIQKNKDYVFCKRFTAKEEKRRLQCGIFLSSDFAEYSYIGTHNKINFVERIDGTEMCIEEIYGIFGLLNSTLFDLYYRILNGSTQVNSTEVNSIPVPPVEKIRKIGRWLIQENDLSTDVCDKIIREVAYE